RAPTQVQRDHLFHLRSLPSRLPVRPTPNPPSRAQESEVVPRVREHPPPAGIGRHVPSWKRASALAPLTPQSEVLDDLAIPVDLGGLEVIQQPTALSDHPEQPAPGRVIALVRLEVLSQV